MTTYFTNKAFRFLRALERNNEREWFHAHKADYEAHLREPFQRLLTDLQPDLATVSLHYRADPKKMNGSLFRIHRDTRFSSNKAPYKNWQSARLYHERHRETPAPAWYLQLRPGDSFFAAGIWHPESAVLRQIRQFIVDNPAGWKAAAHAPAFRRRYRMSEADMLVRRPRGFRRTSPSSRICATGISCSCAAWTRTPSPGRDCARQSPPISRPQRRSWITCARRWTWSSEPGGLRPAAARARPCRLSGHGRPRPPSVHRPWRRRKPSRRHS